MVATVVAASMVARPPAPTPPRASEAPTERPVTLPPVAPPPAGTTYRDFIFETEVVTAPTATKAQSKLWYAEGAWWAGLVQPATNRQTIFRLDWATQLWHDTGTLVDERPTADPDFLWNGEHLYVVSAGPGSGTRHEGRVLRFSYDAAQDRFTLDRNFPVTIFPAGTTAAVITQDSLGTLWVAYAAEQRIWLVRSLENEANWSAPFALPAAPADVTPEDIASVVAFGPGRIGVMWSDQLEDRVYFSVHRDGDPDDAWSEPEIVIDGLGSSDDHINLKAYPDGTGTGVVAALKTSQDQIEPVNALAPLILLAVRPADGTWSTHLVSRVRDRQTRAIVLVDPEARLFYVAATSPARGGEILYKRTSIDAIVFDAGRGERLVSSALDLQINNASGPKHGVTSETGLVVIASDNATGRYLHAVVDLGGGLPPADPADPTRPDRPPAPTEVQPLTLIQNDLAEWTVGPADGTGWAMQDGAPSGALTIAEDGAGTRALRLSAGPDGERRRACREHPEAPPGDRLEVTMQVRLSRLGLSDATIASLRGSGGEAVSIRINDKGEFTWYDGPDKVRSRIAARSGSWYEVSIDVDQTRRTYAFTIATTDGTVVAQATDVAWRTADVPASRRVCLETSSGGPGQHLDLASVRVLQIPAP